MGEGRGENPGRARGSRWRAVCWRHNVPWRRLPRVIVGPHRLPIRGLVSRQSVLRSCEVRCVTL